MRAVNVAVTVTLDNGDEFVLNVADPAPGGDNPAFLTSQVHVALDMLERRLHDALEAVHGAQQYRSPRPSDELLAPRIPTENPFYPEAERVVSDEALARAAADGTAPRDGQLVRFPDLHGDVVFGTISREHGVYEVHDVAAGSPSRYHVGDHFQINTDVPAARWEPAS